MKMNKVAAIIVAVLLVLLVSGGCLLVVYEVNQNQKEAAKVEAEKEVVKYDYATFADYTPNEAFQSIPSLVVDGGKIGTPYEYGTGVYTLNISGTTVEDYKAYLATLQEHGFVKHSDNGEEAMEGYVYTASFTKDDLALTV